MIKSLICDFQKTLISVGFLAAILVTFLLCFTEDVYVDTSDMRKFSALEALFKFDRSFMESKSSFCSLSVFKSALSGYSAMFLPILASFPFVFSQSAERNSGNIRFSIFRAKRLKYYFSKFLCGVISGGICVLLGIALFGIFSFFAFPRLECYPDLPLEFYAPDGIFAEIARKLLSAFIYGCVSTVPAFFLSSFCRNRLCRIRRRKKLLSAHMTTTSTKGFSRSNATRRRRYPTSKRVRCSIQRSPLRQYLRCLCCAAI